MEGDASLQLERANNWLNTDEFQKHCLMKEARHKSIILYDSTYYKMLDSSSNIRCEEWLPLDSRDVNWIEDLRKGFG